MPEEQFVAIVERRLDALESGQTALRRDVQELKTDVQELKTDVQGLKTDVQGLKTDVQGLKTDFHGLKGDVQDLGRQMRVLHEETLDSIRALAPDFGPIRREFTRADDILRQDIDTRLVPLEAAARRRRDRNR